MSYAAIFMVIAFSNSAAAADYELTFTGKWRSGDDLVDGWDWTLPASVAPAKNSGIFNLNTGVPSDFPGHHLKQVNATWRDLEPTEGNYDFSSILNELNDSRYDGVMLNIRGMVVSIEDANGKPAFSAGVTAPEWLSKSASKTSEGLRNGVSITNMNIYDARVKDRLIKLIRRLGQSSIPGHNRLTAQIIHGVSSSRGEEWTGTQASRPEAVAAMEEIIEAWASAYGANARKLAWLKEDPVRLFNAAVVKGGTGVRGGSVEKWLRSAFTPGTSSLTGLDIDSDGYLSVDERFPPIAQNRHFADQNEAYRSGASVPREKWPQNFRLANLRMLQMRRNIAWTDSNSEISPRMVNWLSLELGQNAGGAPDAWVALMGTWTRTGSENRRVRNLERWVYQRDINGVSTQEVLRNDHGFNAAGNDLLPSSYWNVDLARKGNEIGFAVDDKFLSGGPHDVAVKVTFFDSATETWSLEYKKGGGGTGTRSVTGRGTGKVRTATFFLNDFAAPVSGYNFDFALKSSQGQTPFMFVRVIKLRPGGGDAGSGDAPVARPEAPTGVQVSR